MAQPYTQPNKGTLIPGQTIAVNKYTVQVERYLSQGGFAHVYLVRTATPIYNTTHHVLKRIAVPNEAMLTEVKKEVDIMRILKGHPNIVYLIDAAWHRMDNGTYEVFILMEFCSGGGIIDMMNRRLRERLTEEEILTIFVDVCEGLAAMHALRPPLLHRDLKVENILQSSATSYKLCDFGSATPVQKVPSNMQELRMLEADLNRHTTLQYRAPEMVDVFLRRPVDEKSDVWALGVLLYKLCYYTTPFEEHGPLAILNVQYKIPPYPVYSNQMNALIASMLREHGAQRPTVFEVLTHVHSLRGTKSKFSYNVAPKQPPLSPRAIQAPLQALSPNIAPTPSFNDVVSYRSQQSLQPSRSPARNAGTDARDKVLEAIAPMRRGRPSSMAPSPAPSPNKEKPAGLDMKFGAEEDRLWKGVKGHKSGLASFGGGGGINLDTDGFGSAWGLKTAASLEKVDKTESDDSGFGRGFGDSFDPAKVSSGATNASPRPTPSPRPPDAAQASRPPPARMTMTRDAFEGLGLTPSQPAPQTLGEARKTRTGLASAQSSSSKTSQFLHTPSGLGTSNTTYRPPSSHSRGASPSPAVQPSSQSLSPVPPPASSQTWRQNVNVPSADRPAEERFPSLEDLDRTFGTPSALSGSRRPAYSSSQPTSTQTTARPSSRGAGGNGRSANHLAADGGAGKSRYDGVRSQQVTGSAMRESKLASKQSTKPDSNSSAAASTHARPPLSRRHRSSTMIKTESSMESAPSATPPALPPRPLPSPRSEPRDWLTGADDEDDAAATKTTAAAAANTPAPTEQSPQPVLRDSPSKRASFFERSPILLGRALEAESAEVEYHEPLPPATEPEKLRQPDWRAVDRAKDSERRAEERPSTPLRNKAFVTRTGTGSNVLGRLQLPPVDTAATSFPSPSGLTENWSPVAPSPSKESSSSEESPEDLNGYRPRGGVKEKIEEHGRIGRDTVMSGVLKEKGEGEKRRRPAGKGRQSSVHDLVDLWGGGLNAGATEKESGTKPAEKRRSVIMPAPAPPAPSKPSALSSANRPPPRTESPQPISYSRTEGVPSTRTGTSHSPTRQHRKQPSNTTKAMRSPIPIAPASSAPSVSAQARSRPQSMFITSHSQSSLTRQTSSSSSSSMDPASTKLAQNKLSPPLPAGQAARSIRRSSITNMVQRYEAIGGGSVEAKGQGPGPGPPALAAKPAALQAVKMTGASDTASLPSPSAVAERFPKLSPHTSPVLSRASLALPDDHSTGKQFGSARTEKEPTKNKPSPSGLPSRASPIGRTDFPSSSSINGLPPRASPSPEHTRPLAETTYTGTGIHVPTPRFPPSRKSTMPPPVEAAPSNEVRTPSPEKPFQGVSKLIDRWNRAVDESGTLTESGGKRGGVQERRAGVVGSESGRGR